MKKYYLYIYAIISVLAISCDKEFLDRKLDTNYGEEQVFSSYTPMRDFGIAIYTSLPEGFNRIDAAFLASATDDAVHSGTATTIQRFNNGSWGPFINPDDQWARLYTGVRKANFFLEKTVDYKNVLYRDTITAAGKTNYNNQINDIKWLRAEARFLRAYFYFELLKRYGGVPLILTTMSADESPRPRNTFNECANFIVTEIDAINNELRNTWSDLNSGNQIGRATKGAALALKSRVLLYAASPLNNPANDLQKWVSAADAAKAVIALNRYSLLANYRDLFRSMSNNEFIFERRYSASNNLERTTFPAGFDGAVGGINPSQNLIDSYETTNGLPVNADPSYNSQNPYVNRDPRLLMTVIVNGSTYKGRPVEAWIGGKDGLGKPRATRTGYYLKKFADEGLDLSLNRTSNHAWVYFRYAEILLNYAEAMNEAYGPDVTPAGYTLSARQAINLVRKRSSVNMPNVIASSQPEFREKVRNERRVELAFEEHRFWDVRRWRIGQVFASPVYGMKILKNGTSFSFEKTPVENRVFEDKMYLYPIPGAEIDKAGGSLTQNPQW
ncbi:RagB/SusD family nutrient uptake outer membrane protein [Paradesertivirga mongoliensis]|uniref:RagB/SusD family nutrient uptake outer membrane protein n=1 Tax=Paradesertivirga mongoliensis TaxID=2100740 RepID=A0ABW4ZQZ9_9SPHI|nr:RagB/SusD family nutrient uptake outer membrane protein [Pedobacter mongoliensis]